MKLKIGNDEFCVHCMEWREYDEKGRCKICNHIIHKEDKESEKEGYSRLKTESSSFEDFDEDTNGSDY